MISFYFLFLCAYSKTKDFNVIPFHYVGPFLLVQVVEIIPSALVLFILRKLPPRRVSDQYHPINWICDHSFQFNRWLRFNSFEGPVICFSYHLVLYACSQNFHLSFSCKFFWFFTQWKTYSWTDLECCSSTYTTLWCGTPNMSHKITFV